MLKIFSFVRWDMYLFISTHGHSSWWRHQMETFSALLAICAGNSPVPGEFPTQRPVTRSFDVFCDLCLNKQLRKQSRGWCFETLSCSLWRHCNDADVSLLLAWISLWTTVKGLVRGDTKHMWGQPDYFREVICLIQRNINQYFHRSNF